MPRRTPSKTTSSRKQQHIEITLKKNVGFRSKTTGLESLEFVHNALPEIDFAGIDTGVEFLGRRMNAPLMVSCMTGGYADALRINRQLAEVCRDAGIAMGVGSQRQALEDARFHKTFAIVREVAGSIPIVGNIGAAEVARMSGPDQVRRLAEMLKADAFAVHLNPVQEFLQPEGTPRFRGVLGGIAMLVKKLPIPVIVKEIGAGISVEVARRLLDAGVRYIDVAGAGGTSWAGVEALRSTKRDVALRFWDWGIPTADAVRSVASLKPAVPFTLIASGGIASGIDAAKCIALGADLAASARPMIQELHRGGQKGLAALLDTWIRELRGVMFLTGSGTLAALRTQPLMNRAGT